MIDGNAAQWANAVIRAGRITASDVTRLRDLFPMGLVGLEDAETLFQVEALLTVKHESWSDTFCEMIVDLLVWGERPTGVLSRDRADWVFLQCGRTRTALADRLLESLLNEANTVPLWFAPAVRRRSETKAAVARIGATSIAAAPRAA